MGLMVDSDTVALWRLDESTASSNAVDETGNYHLVAQNSPGIATGKIDGCRTFNGTNQRFVSAQTLAPRPIFLGEWTIEGWIKIGNLSTNAVVFSYDATGTIGTANTLAGVEVISGSYYLRMYWEHSDPGVTEELVTPATNSVPQNTWTHFAVRKKLNVDGVTYDMTIFINGVTVTTRSQVQNADGGDSSDHAIALGGFSNDSQYWMLGSLDDVRFSSVARTDDEIYADYQTGARVIKILREPPKSWTGSGYSLDFDGPLARDLDGEPHFVHGSGVKLHLGNVVSFNAGRIKTPILYNDSDNLLPTSPTAPVISDVNPSGTTIQPNNSVSFGVTASELASSLIYVKYSGLPTELIFNKNTGFLSPFSNSKLIQSGNLYTYTISRSGGWPEAPILSMAFTDKYGQTISKDIAWTLSGQDTTPPIFVLARSVDARTVDVFFSEAVQPEDAMNTANYSISPTLTIKSIQQITPRQFRLTTSNQSSGQDYTITASNIHDLSGNVIS